MFLREFYDSRFNMAMSTTGDGVRKSSVTQKSVFPVGIRIESLAPEVRLSPESQHMVLLLEADYDNTCIWFIWQLS